MSQMHVTFVVEAFSKEEGVRIGRSDKLMYAASGSNHQRLDNVLNWLATESDKHYTRLAVFGIGGDLGEITSPAADELMKDFKFFMKSRGLKFVGDQG